MDERSIVAAFDFDGTLTYEDTLVPFLRFTSGTALTYGKLALELPTLTSYVLGLASRQETKEAILRRFLANKSLHAAQEMGRTFAHEQLPNLVKPKALKKVGWHLERGHRCILVSANLDLYLEPWAKHVGFHHVICSQSEVNERGVLTGNLRGLNCWGSEKIRRLNDFLGPRENYLLYAYGDSKGDRELLAAADFAFYRTME